MLCTRESDVSLQTDNGLPNQKKTCNVAKEGIIRYICSTN